MSSAAFSSSPLDLRAYLRPIVLLAVGLVLVTTFADAFVAQALTGLPWAAAFVLGAILAPTDPVAAEAIFGRLGVPERVSTVIGGESLVNEGAGQLLELRARLDAARAALEKLGRLGDDERVSPESQERMREYYEERIRRYEAGLEAGGTTEEYAESSAAWRDWRRELIAAEREALVSLRNEGRINPEAMRRIERDLDLEESRIGG